MFQDVQGPDTPLLLTDSSPEIEALHKQATDCDLNCVSVRPKVSKEGKTTWCVILRMMDCQITGFENAALSVFVAMIANIATQFDVDFTVPVSKVDENMKRAVKRNACKEGRFFWKVPQ